MQYQNKKFSVLYGGKQYSDNWERNFGPKCPECDNIRSEPAEGCKNAFHEEESG